MTNYTNAALIVNKDYKGPDDLDGLFSGWSDSTKSYNTTTWGYQRNAVNIDTSKPITNFSDELATLIPGRPKEDPTLQDPNTVFQILKRHYARMASFHITGLWRQPHDVEVTSARNVEAAQLR